MDNKKSILSVIITYSSAGCIWAITNDVMAIIVALAGIIASIAGARYWINENKRREIKIRMEKEWHRKRMNDEE